MLGLTEQHIYYGSRILQEYRPNCAERILPSRVTFIDRKRGNISRSPKGGEGWEGGEKGEKKGGGKSGEARGRTEGRRDGGVEGGKSGGLVGT